MLKSEFFFVLFKLMKFDLKIGFVGSLKLVDNSIFA